MQAKDNSDTLVWALCYIYKRYTGEVPLSSAREDGFLYVYEVCFHGVSLRLKNTAARQSGGRPNRVDTAGTEGLNLAPFLLLRTSDKIQKLL